MKLPEITIIWGDKGYSIWDPEGAGGETKMKMCWEGSTTKICGEGSPKKIYVGGKGWKVKMCEVGGGGCKKMWEGVGEKKIDMCGEGPCKDYKNMWST